MTYNDNVDYKTINNVSLNPIGIGTWCIGGDIHTTDTEKIITANYDNHEREIAGIKYSIAQGQNHIDTAQLYGAGHTEEVVGQAIKGLDRSKLFIASKIWKSHAQRSAIPYAVEDILRRLQTDYLDMIYVHAYWDHVPMADPILGLCDTVDHGLAKGIAVSNYTLDQLQAAQQVATHPILANQIVYNLLARHDATPDLLQYAQEQHIAIVAYRPLERRLLADQCTHPTILDIGS